jgi:hypothetical protein
MQDDDKKLTEILNAEFLQHCVDHAVLLPLHDIDAYSFRYYAVIDGTVQGPFNDLKSARKMFKIGTTGFYKSDTGYARLVELNRDIDIYNKSIMIQLNFKKLVLEGHGTKVSRKLKSGTSSTVHDAEHRLKVSSEDLEV